MQTLHVRASLLPIPYPTLYALLLGVLGVALSIVGAWVPSFWGDEVATMRTLSISPTDLWSFLGGIDAVHGFYDILLRPWAAIFGTSELSLRFPSALANGVSCALLFQVGRKLHSLPLGVVAALIFAFLPRTTLIGTEARSSAIATVLVVGCTWALLTALTTSQPRWFVAYAVLLFLSALTFVYTALIVIAHVLVAFLMHAGRKRIFAVALTAAVPLLAMSPFIALSFSQREQVSWIGDLGPVTLTSILVEPWLTNSMATAVVLASCGALIVFRNRRSARASTLTMPALIGALWALVPVALILAAHVTVAPLFRARYLAFAAPGFALLVACCLLALKPGVLRIAMVIVLVVSIVPTYVSQRTEFAKNDSDLRQISETIARFSLQGDAIFFERSGAANTPRKAMYAYPDGFERVRDIALVEPFPLTGTFSDRTESLAESIRHLRTGQRLLFVGGTTSDCNALNQEALRTAGYGLDADVPMHASRLCIFSPRSQR